MLYNFYTLKENENFCRIYQIKTQKYIQKNHFNIEMRMYRPMNKISLVLLALNICDILNYMKKYNTTLCNILLFAIMLTSFGNPKLDVTLIARLLMKEIPACQFDYSIHHQREPSVSCLYNPQPIYHRQWMQVEEQKKPIPSLNDVEHTIGNSISRVALAFIL